MSVPVTVWMYAPVIICMHMCVCGYWKQMCGEDSTVGTWVPSAYTGLRPLHSHPQQHSEPAGPFAAISEVTSPSLDYGIRIYPESMSGWKMATSSGSVVMTSL